MTLQELRILQALPLEAKMAKSAQRIREMVSYYGVDNILFSFSGGLDSTVGLHFARTLFPELKAVSVRAIECRENRELIDKTPNVIEAKPKYSQAEVIKKFGYPVISKRVSKQLRMFKHPSPKNEKSRNLALTGITSTGKQAPTYKLAKKHRYLIGAPFEISEKCCYYQKEKALIDKCKELGCASMGATTAEESFTRRDAYINQGGCNSFKGLGSSIPFAFWTRQDMLEYKIRYCVEISTAYGDVKKDNSGKWYTTKADRTGCPICLFGIDKEKEPNRMQRMYYDDPPMWNVAINIFGCGKVLDFMGIPYVPRIKDDSGQTSFFDSSDNLSRSTPKPSVTTSLRL